MVEHGRTVIMDVGNTFRDQLQLMYCFDDGFNELSDIHKDLIEVRKMFFNELKDSQSDTTQFRKDGADVREDANRKQSKIYWRQRLTNPTRHWTCPDNKGQGNELPPLEEERNLAAFPCQRSRSAESRFLAQTFNDS